MAQGFKIYAALLALDVFGDLSQNFALPFSRAFEVRQRGVFLTPREGKQHKRLGIVSDGWCPQRGHQLLFVFGLVNCGLHLSSGLIECSFGGQT